MRRILLATLLTCAAATGLGAQTTDSLKTNLPLADYTAPGRYVVREVRLHGASYYPEDMMKTVMGLAVGDTVSMPGTYVSDAIRKVWGLRYFSDVRVDTSTEGDRVDLDVWLTERPRITRWMFEGVRKTENTELQEKLKLTPGAELSEFALDKNKFHIRNYFSAKGFRNAEVTTRISSDTIIPNAVRVTFVVDKKPRVRIGAINFTGNGRYADGKLRRTFKKTHRVSWKFFQGNKLKEEEYEADKENLLEFYNSKGFRNATVLRDSIYRISDKRIGIDIALDEGNKFYYRNVSWTGNSIYATEYLSQLLGVERGATYDRKSLHKRLGVGRGVNMEDDSSVAALYQNQGYLMSGIEPAEIVVGADSLDLDIKIFEGEKFTMNEIRITGNQRVNDDVIRRELSTFPGELYSRQLLMSTMYRLSSMGHFSPEKIQPDIQPVTNNLVDIGWALEEQASDKLDVSGGWGAGMFVGSVGVQLNNVSIGDVFKRGAWRPYPQGQNQQLAIRGQSNGSYYSALSASFTEPWLGGRKPHALTVSGYYSAESNGTYYEKLSGTDPTGYFRTLGLAAGIGFRLNWPDRYFTLYTELGYQRYMTKEWGRYFLMDTGTANVVSFKTVLSRSSVSQPIFPRYGSEFSLSVAVTPPWSLMDGKNYSDPNLSDAERYRWLEYHKWLFSGRMFHPLTRDQKLVLMARAEMGYLGHYNPNKLSPFEAFRVGGDGMTGYTMYGEDIIAMRGYEDSQLNPAEATDNKSRVYTKYTMELRYPILLQGQTNIYGLVFAEAGNGYLSWKKFDPFQLKRSAGAGVRITLPVVGMLGFDWGYGFDVPSGSADGKPHGGQIHFTFGKEF